MFSAVKGRNFPWLFINYNLPLEFFCFSPRIAKSMLWNRVKANSASIFSEFHWLDAFEALLRQNNPASRSESGSQRRRRDKFLGLFKRKSSGNNSEVSRSGSTGNWFDETNPFTIPPIFVVPKRNQVHLIRGKWQLPKWIFSIHQ